MNYVNINISDSFNNGANGSQNFSDTTINGHGNENFSGAIIPSAAYTDGYSGGEHGLWPPLAFAKRYIRRHHHRMEVA